MALWDLVGGHEVPGDDRVARWALASGRGVWERPVGMVGLSGWVPGGQDDQVAWWEIACGHGVLEDD